VFYLLGQEEEIIFTFFTLMVLDPPAEPLVAPEVAAPGAPAPSSPVMRTWCPTWSASLLVSPES
jgi:hypothetical protein